MLKPVLAGLLLFGLTATAWSQPASGAACPPLLDHRFKRLQDEAPQHLCQYAGKVLLIVNTASYCGFTHQYQGLETLFARYGKQGLVVLGFPSNDFGNQEPGSSKQIADLCYNTYGVQFPMFAKTAVTGPAANPLFAALAKQSSVAPAWNFTKYLVGRDGQVIEVYPSRVGPLDKRLVADIDKALRQK